MRFLNISGFALAAAASWFATVNCATMAGNEDNTLCARDGEAIEAFQSSLSAASEVYLPGSEQFQNASERWSNLALPTVNVVVVPATEEDLVEAVKIAIEYDMPYLVYNGVHGATTTLGEMKSGVEILVKKLTGVEISEDGQTAKILGGTISKNVTDALWAAGKQTVTGTCECVSYLGPALGGGHGWLQGHHGLIGDQIVSLDIILADGSVKTVDESSELKWALNGAGHNFGIITSVTTKIYDIEHKDWAVDNFIFTGDKVEEVYEVANKYLIEGGNQPVDLHHWSYWVNVPTISDKAVILFYLIQEGVTAVNASHSDPFRAIGPVSVDSLSGDYRDLAGWTGISTTDKPCLKSGLINPRFPIYLDQFDTAALRKTYDVYAEATAGDSPFSGSNFMFEAYSNQGVKAISSRSSAFAFRDANILAAPLLTYTPNGTELDARAESLGNELRSILHEASGRSEFRAYVNYAFGNENNTQIYGEECWRQSKLKELKTKYDPEEKFSFYNPIKLS